MLCFSGPSKPTEAWSENGLCKLWKHQRGQWRQNRSMKGEPQRQEGCQESGLYTRLHESTCRLSGFGEGNSLISLRFLKHPDLEINCRGKTDAEKLIGFRESVKKKSSGLHESTSCVGGMKYERRYLLKGRLYNLWKNWISTMKKSQECIYMYIAIHICKYMLV